MKIPIAVSELARTAAVTSGRLARIDRFLDESKPGSPCLIVDLETVRRRYRTLAALLPHAAIYYAVKANPSRGVIAALAQLGANFDLASAGEIACCGDLNIAMSRCSFGNTIKREADIRSAWRGGIDLFAFDSGAELDKIARAAPGARVFCRLAVQGRKAEWPLTRKFGCSVEYAAQLLMRAHTVGLRPFGVSFHVGSQQMDPTAWERAIDEAAQVFGACARSGLELELVNLGGGLPAHYREPVAPLETYVEVIARALKQHFGGSPPRLFIEPGRYLVGDAGLLRSQILLISKRSPHGYRWVYIDAGRYNGLPETLQERIVYRIRTRHDDSPGEPSILAGPTCDSTDILYQHSGFELPRAIEIGEPIDFLSAGAYTASYASVGFNGFAPIQTYCI